MKAEITAITQWEGTPESWPAVEGVTGDMLAICWQRIEHYVARRWAARDVVWTISTSGGEWVAPLGPVLSESVDSFRWIDGEWTAYPTRKGPYGFCLPAGHVQISASVGTLSAAIPAAVREAVKRLAAYYTAEQPVPAGARSYSANVGQLSESISIDPAAVAKAMQNSGAADLLRPYRRAV